jgi:hypothetical protein
MFSVLFVAKSTAGLQRQRIRLMVSVYRAFEMLAGSISLSAKT